jgi:Heterokaryon incompatibility protein (HET)
MVIDVNHFDLRNRDTDNAEKEALFDLTLRDLLSGATSGCSLFSWILNDECTSREALASQVVNTLPEDDAFHKVMLALQDASIGIDAFYKNSSTKTTLGEVGSTSNGQYLSHRLFARPYQGTGNVLDISNIEFFGLWNPDTNKISYRTKHGFRVFTAAEDPASRTISTRPIDPSPGSDENLDRISTWLQGCQSSHAKCNKSSEGWPERLIEIVELPTRFGLRLRHCQDLDGVAFAALSYCWGGDQSLKCLTSNFPQMMTIIPLKDLPPTILDAVKLCRAIGLKYIWIDAFCIIQDDPTDKEIEIAKMPHIYGSAALTIAAARSVSVLGGFLHQRQFTAQSDAFILPYRCSDGQIGSVTLTEIDTSEEPIDERGWTLQERLLSSKTVEFGSRQTRWICQQSEYKANYTDGWRENAPYSPQRHDHLRLDEYAGKGKITLSNGEDYERLLRQWNTIVEAYTRRKLTLTSDRAWAISGIAERFAAILGDTYIAGMWKACLLSGLLWQISKFNTASAGSVFQGPSWSWTAVNGPVSFPYEYYSFRSGVLENYTAEVVDLKMDLTNNLAPYGAIRERSGRLKLRARTAIGAWAKTPGANLVDKDNEMIGFFGRNDSGIAIGMADLFRDVKDTGLSHYTGHSGDREPLTVVELYNNVSGASWQCSGLVLQAVRQEDSVYRRVGMFEFETRRKGQRNDESTEDWRKRIDLEFNWFKNCEYREIEVV